MSPSTATSETEATAASKAGPRYGAPALEKGLDILELLAGESQGLTQARIAERLGRSVGEIFRMLIALEQRRYIALKRPEDHYVLTLKLFEISHRHPPTKRLIDEALPLLHEIARETEQSCHLAVHRDGAILIIAQVDTPGSVNFAVRLGSHFDLVNTASGRILLAFQSPDERGRMLANRRSRGAEEYDEQALEPVLSAVRERGYVEMASTTHRGIRNLGYPVFDFSGAAIAALSMPFMERFDVKPYASIPKTRRILDRAARKLSGAIGASAAHGAALSNRRAQRIPSN